MNAKLNSRRRRRLKALREAERASATSWWDERTPLTSCLEGSSSGSSELGTLETCEASSSASCNASVASCDTDFSIKEGAFELSAPQVLVADGHLLQRIRSLEEENQLLRTKKDNLTYRSINVQDQLDRCRELNNVLERERDEARSSADEWWTEAKQQEERANAAQAYADKAYQDACQAHDYTCAIETELWGARNNINALAYYLSQEQALNTHLQTTLYKQDQLIDFGEGMMHGMLQSQSALQKEAVALHQECSALSDENTVLRIIAGLPPKCCPSSEIIPASAVQCPAGARPRPPIGSSLQPAPSPLICGEEMGTSVCEPRPHHVKTAADDTCAAPSSVLLIADCTCGHTPPLQKAHELSGKPAESTAEQLMQRWIEQPQHLMSQQMHDVAPEHQMAQSDAAAKKSRIGGLIGSALGALFRLGQRRAPLVS